MTHLRVRVIEREGQWVIWVFSLVLFDFPRPAKMVWVVDDAVDKAAFEHNLAKSHCLLGEITALTR